MGKVEQLNWDKLRPKQPEKKKDYAKADDIYWRYKKDHAPTDADVLYQEEHLSNIRKEE